MAAPACRGAALTRERLSGWLPADGRGGYRGGRVLVIGAGLAGLALDYQRFHRFLLTFPESSLALFRLTVERLIAQRGERRPKRTSV